MIERNRTEERDEVLFAFHVACESPTPDFVDKWVRRYPQYEDDFRQHAGILAARLVHAQTRQLEPDETMLARGRSRALNAEIEARLHEAGSVGTFIQFVEVVGTTIAALARRIDIDRMVLGELAAGRMALPIGQRLTDALVATLKTMPQKLDVAIRQARQRLVSVMPRLSGPQPSTCSPMRRSFLRASL